VFKKSVTYIDLNGVEKTEDFFFGIDLAEVEFEDKPKDIRALNCPNCGAPITDEKCQYCGTKFNYVRKELRYDGK